MANCKTTNVRQQIRNISNADQRFSTGSSNPCADADDKLNIAEIGVNLTDSTLEVGTTSGIKQVPLMEGNAGNNNKVPQWKETSGKFEFVDLPSGGAAGTYANVLFVSASGDNGTAVKGEINKPWLNIFTAVSQAVSGDTIYQIGDQTISEESEGNLAKDGVNYVINGNLTSMLNESLFSDTEGATVINIFCSGTIRLQDSELDSPMFKITNQNSLYTIKSNLCQSYSMVASVVNGEMIHYGTIQSDQQNVVLVTDTGEWYHEGLVIHNSTDGSSDDFALSMNTGIDARITQRGDIITFTKGTTSLTKGIINFVDNDENSRFSIDGNIYCKGTGNNGADSHLMFTSGKGQFQHLGAIYASNLPSILYYTGFDIGANIHLQMNRWEALGDSTYTRGVFEDLGNHPEEDQITIIIDGNGNVEDGIFARVGSDASFPTILKGRAEINTSNASAHGVVLLHNDVTFDGLTVFMPTGSGARSVITTGTSRNLRVYGCGFQSNNFDENNDTPGRIVLKVHVNNYIVNNGDVH